MSCDHNVAPVTVTIILCPVVFFGKRAISAFSPNANSKAPAPLKTRRSTAPTTTATTAGTNDEYGKDEYEMGRFED